MPCSDGGDRRVVWTPALYAAAVDQACAEAHGVRHGDADGQRDRQPDRVLVSVTDADDQCEPDTDAHSESVVDTRAVTVTVTATVTDSDRVGHPRAVADDLGDAADHAVHL